MQLLALKAARKMLIEFLYPPGSGTRWRRSFEFVPMTHLARNGINNCGLGLSYRTIEVQPTFIAQDGDIYDDLDHD
jgi:hypothetical protein